MGSCHRQVTEGLKALRSGKASAFLPAQNETKQKASGNPGVFSTFSAIACGNVRARQGVAKAEARLTFRPSIPQSRIRVTAPFTQGSLWRPLSRLMLCPGVAFFVTKTISMPRCAGPRAVRAPASGASPVRGGLAAPAGAFRSATAAVRRLLARRWGRMPPISESTLPLYRRGGAGGP